jgi:hypothetical protein
VTDLGNAIGLLTVIKAGSNMKQKKAKWVLRGQVHGTSASPLANALSDAGGKAEALEHLHRVRRSSWFKLRGRRQGELTRLAERIGCEDGFSQTTGAQRPSPFKG